MAQDVPQRSRLLQEAAPLRLPCRLPRGSIGMRNAAAAAPWAAAPAQCRTHGALALLQPLAGLKVPASELSLTILRKLLVERRGMLLAPPAAEGAVGRLPCQPFGPTPHAGTFAAPLLRGRRCISQGAPRHGDFLYVVPPAFLGALSIRDGRGGAVVAVPTRHSCSLGCAPTQCSLILLYARRAVMERDLL